MLEFAAGHTFAGFALDVAFTAPAGVTALFGPSGSGKSTVLSIVAGLLRPQTGRVVLDGATLLDTAARKDMPAELRRCGIVFQDARLFPHLSVETNLRYGASRAPKGAEFDAPGFDEIVELLGIRLLLARRPRALSGGEKQRVALGRALLSRPRLLLMDEPLAALDAARKAEILPFIERLRDVARLPVLYVTHALDEVDRLADTLVLLHAGQVQAMGTVEALSTRTDLPTLSGRRDAGAVVPCTVMARDELSGLTQLAFPGGCLAVPLRPDPPGTMMRLRLRARDVAVATERPHGVSIHNILAGTITQIVPAGPHEAFVGLAIGPTPILARVTRNAVAKLSLAPGMTAFALVKSTAFDHG
jgi:molybdate transport system ATP-binding protein